MIRTAIVASIVLLTLCAHAGEKKDLKVFISADMEGVGMVTSRKSATDKGREYDLYCRLMTEEVNAAVQGALDAGATQVVVRDGHWNGLNIIPDKLHPKAHLVRTDSGGPLNMMEGIDKSFDAVIFLGYHARAGNQDGWSAHTMWSAKFFQVTINGKQMPEGGINALIAGYFGVPVVMLTGDAAACREIRMVSGPIECAIVKKGIGKATYNIPIQEARSLIRKKTINALRRRKEFKPYRLKSPYTAEITFVYPDDADHAGQLPGARRTAERSVAYTHKDLLESLKFLTNSMFMLAGAIEE